MSDAPRTEMKCRICHEFSSASTCYRCESSPVFFAWCQAKLKIAELEAELEGLRHDAQHPRD